MVKISLETFSSLYKTLNTVRTIPVVQDSISFICLGIGLYRIFAPSNPNSPKKIEDHRISKSDWKSVASTVSLLGVLSYLGTGVANRPFISLLKKTLTPLLSRDRVEFFLSTKHVFYFKLASYLIGIPATLHSLYNISQWIGDKLSRTKDAQKIKKLDRKDVFNAVKMATTFPQS
jgi:hypothetical protein